MNVTIEADDPEKWREFRKRIVSTERVKGTRTGTWVVLECGHRVAAFGDLDLAGGTVLCQECRAAATA